MKLKQLESAIQEICETLDFNKSAQIQLEQYSTPPRLAAEFLLSIQDDITDNIIIDLGCGCGVLSAGISILGCSYLYCIDIDPNCLNLTKDHLTQAEINAEYIHGDVEQLNLKKFADVVLTNPPFGTRKPGIDWVFVQKGLQMADLVYSFHKSSTRKGLMKKANEEGVRAEVLMTVNFELPKMYKMHKQKSVGVEVDIWRFYKGN